MPVHEGQRVKKGDVLLRLDRRPFEIALAGATANRDGIVLTLNAMKLDYKRMLREVDVKQARLDSDQANFERYAGLVKSGGVTRADYDNARFLLMADKQGVEALKVTAAVQLARLGGDPDVDVKTMNEYLQAQARVDEAQRQLDHTVIYAPFSGIVTQVDTVQPGMYLAAATAAFGLVSTENVWIEANPKETELTYVKRGRPGRGGGRHLSRAHLEGRSRGDRAKQWVGILRAAGAEYVRQLGEGGAAHSGAHRGRAQGRRSGIARGHERGDRHRHRPCAKLARPVLDDGLCLADRGVVGPRTVSPDHHAVHRRRDVDAGSGPDDRQRRAAVHAGQPVGYV